MFNWLLNWLNKPRIIDCSCHDKFWDHRVTFVNHMDRGPYWQTVCRTCLDPLYLGKTRQEAEAKLRGILSGG